MPSSPTSTTSSLSPLQELYTGAVPWDRLHPFPRQSAAERERGDTAVAVLARLLRDRVDPEEVESTGRLPQGLMDELRAGGFLQLMIGEELGGLGLSPYNAFRVLQVAASWCSPVAFSLAITNGFGSGSYLPLLPDGALNDLITGWVRRGMVSAGADAESIGTANERRATTATLTDDGACYEITGEKIYIGNGTLADLMDVSATLRTRDGREEVRLFFVEREAAEFEVRGRHEFMGLHGAEIGIIGLDRVRVPAFHLMESSEESWRMRPGERAAAAPMGRVDREMKNGGFRPTDLGQLAALGRILVIGPPSLAIARLCLHWSKEFVRRRTIDGRGLGEYEEIQRRIAATAADVYTIDSVMTWVLHSHRFGDNQPELTAAKNVTSLACWRAVDRTMSLLGGEGYETAASKARRGAQPLPVERFFRDARALRVAGGVDFMVDRWSAESALSTCWFTPDPPDPTRLDEAVVPDGAGLSPACRTHLEFLFGQSRRLATACARLTAGRAQADVFREQRRTTVLGRIGGELLSMSIVLARAGQSDGDHAELSLADLSCEASRHRLAALWPWLDDPPNDRSPAYADAVAAWLGGTAPDFLVRDVIIDIPYTAFSGKGSDRHA